jgi:hypothetical protein
MAHGQGDQIFVTFSGFAGVVDNKAYNSIRIWGKFYPSVGLEEKVESRIQGTRSYLLVYPNPFRLSATIKIQDSSTKFQERNSKRQIEMKVYDAGGRMLRQWDYQTIGQSAKITWYGDDDNGQKLPSGVYFVILQEGDYSKTKKVLLIR